MAVITDSNLCKMLKSDFLRLIVTNFLLSLKIFPVERLPKKNWQNLVFKSLLDKVKLNFCKVMYYVKLANSGQYLENSS